MVMHMSDTRDKKYLAWLITLTATMTFIGSTLYMPSLPNMTIALNATNTEVQNTLTIYFLGFSVAQLFFGPASDRFGRKPILLMGIALATAAGVLSALASNMEIIMISRLLQGIGLAAPNSLARVLLRDVYTDKELMKVVSYFTMAISVAPAITPTIGGYLETLYGWEGVFMSGSVYLGAAFLLIFIYLPETNRHMNPQALQIGHMFEKYWSLLKQKKFMGHTLSASAVVGGFMGYGVTTPFLYQQGIGITPDQNGWLAFITAGAVMFGSYIYPRLANKYGAIAMVSIGCTMMFISGATMLVFALLEYMNLWVILLPSILFFIAGGIIFPVTYTESFKDIGRMAGFAGAFFGFFFMTGSMLITNLAAILPEANQTYLALIFISLSFFVWFMKTFLIQKHPVDPS